MRSALPNPNSYRVKKSRIESRRLEDGIRRRRLLLEQLEDRRLLAIYGPPAELTAPTIEAGARFGGAVAVTEGVAFLGAPSETVNGLSAAGALHLFGFDDQNDTDPSNDTWNSLVTLAATDPGTGNSTAESGAGFGSAVAFSFPFIAVGAPGEDLGGSDRGAVYVVDISPIASNPPSGPPIFHKLTAPSPADGDAFGVSLDVAGNRLVVGAPGTDGSAGADQGAVYAFTYDGTTSTWLPQATLPATGTEEAGAAFGTAVAISANQNVPFEAEVIVGAPLEDGGAPSSD
jgi:hypothetical protein